MRFFEQLIFEWQTTSLNLVSSAEKEWPQNNRLNITVDNVVVVVVNCIC